MHHALIETCQQHGVKFLTSVFSVSRVPFLASLGLEAIKVGAGDSHKQDLLDAAMASFAHVFVSTSGHSAWGGSFVDWLATVPIYPAPHAGWALQQVQELGYGYSDHTEGVYAAAIAIAMGAPVVEVHVQIPEQARPPQSWEKTMYELKELVEWAKIVEQQTTGDLVDVREARARYANRWQ